MNMQNQYQNTSPLLSIKTTLTIWVIFQSEGFKSHIQNQLETHSKLKGVFVHAVDLAALTKKIQSRRISSLLKHKTTGCKPLMNCSLYRIHSKKLQPH